LRHGEEEGVEALAVEERRIGMSLELQARVKRELQLHVMTDHAEGWAKGLDGNGRTFSSRSYSEQTCGKRDAEMKRPMGACAKASVKLT
jgi:hypothetical protein